MLNAPRSASRRASAASYDHVATSTYPTSRNAAAWAGVASSSTRSAFNIMWVLALPPADGRTSGAVALVIALVMPRAHAPDPVVHLVAAQIGGLALRRRGLAVVLPVHDSSTSD